MLEPTSIPLLAMGWYAIFMFIMIPILGIAWVIYYFWNKKMEALEDAEKKKGSKRLQKTHTEVSDWAQQMAQFKGPPKRPPNQPDE